MAATKRISAKVVQAMLSRMYPVVAKLCCCGIFYQQEDERYWYSWIITVK